MGAGTFDFGQQKVRNDVFYIAIFEQTLYTMILKKSGPVVLAIGILTFVSCQKENSIENGKVTPPPTGDSISLSDRQNDTTLDYARDIYLWYNQIPATFDAHQYGDPNEVMTAIRQYSTEPGFTDPVDRWSFAIKQTEWDDLSSGSAQDFGLNVFFLQDGDLRVKAVEPNSPAGAAGVHRGWQIVKVNNSSNITIANVDFLVDAIYNAGSSSFTFKKPDGSTVDLVLNAAAYQSNPIYLDTVYNTGSKNVGYLVFNSFLGDTAQIYSGFERVFNRFQAAGVSEVIIDLRYNGGGYVSVQQKLANYLVSIAGNGNVMMNQEYNDKYTQYNETTEFGKIGSLNLSRIFFIVSDNTASASELLINNMKPWMDVKIVGPEASYGKPVGYFPIPVGDWYIFPVSFRSTNKNGEGKYFNGLTPDKLVADGLDKDWGDQNEACLSSVIKYIGTGSFALGEIPGTAAGRSGTSNVEVTRTNSKFTAKDFKGMVDPRRVK
jgi:carboxyl-terminal processing protease